MRSAIYARTSTLTHSQQHSIEEQIERLRTNLLSRGAQAADEHIFRDEGRSGATLNRLPSTVCGITCGLATMTIS